MRVRFLDGNTFCCPRDTSKVLLLKSVNTAALCLFEWSTAASTSGVSLGQGYLIDNHKHNGIVGLFFFNGIYNLFLIRFI